MHEILLDTNIILYAINKSDKDCKKARNYINDNLPKLAVSDQNINEALRVLTHTKNKKPADIKTALKAVRRITDECTHITPNLETRDTFYRLVKKYKISSKNIFDTYLVATALTNSISHIVTSNVRDFKVFKEIYLVEF